MNAFKTTPLLALTTLEKIAEEIPSGVSAETMGETVALLGPSPHEITNKLHQGSADSLKGILRSFWEIFEVEKKLKVVKDLKVADENKFGSGRSFQEKLKTTRIKCQRLKKEALLEKLKQTEGQNQELENILKTKADLIKTQIDTIKTCDFVM